MGLWTTGDLCGCQCHLRQNSTRRPDILKINFRIVVSLNSAQPVRQLILDLLLQRGRLLGLYQLSFPLCQER
jgi:hypothetical protein